MTRTPPPRTAPPRSQPAPLGLFYPHGVWAPAVKLMRQLDFRAKALIIAVCFMLPLGLTAWSWSSIVLEQRRIVVLERQGLSYIQAAVPVMQSSQQLRAIADRVAAGESVASNEREVAAAALTRSLAALQAREAELGTVLGSGKLFKVVHEAALGQLSGQADKAGASASVGAVAGTLDLVKKVAGSSELLLDPEAASFHVMRAAVMELPEVNIAASQIRRLGAQLLSQADDKRTALLIDRMARLHIGLERMGQAYDDAIGVDASLQAALQPKLIDKVRASAYELQNASGEIASASADLSARTEAGAASLQEQAATMEQIGSTVAATASRAGNAATLAGENARATQQGGEVIGQVVSTMREIQDSSRRIGDIIGVIDGIAFQTNILALNAAVEAARAGEHGLGFAVVASEVRTLAQRSASAAREIKTLISDSVTRIDGGTRIVEDAGRSIGVVVDAASEVNQQFSEIAGSAREQASGVEQIGAAIQDLDRSTQQNAALVEQTSASAAALRQQADALQVEIGRFRLG